MSRNRRNIAGERFGKLVAIERVAAPVPCVNKGSWWKCQCDCGNIKLANMGNLVSGTVRSCGCLRREASKRKRKQEGMVYGNLTLISKHYDHERVVWKVRCNGCGVEFEKKAKELHYYKDGCSECRMNVYEW